MAPIPNEAEPLTTSITRTPCPIDQVVRFIAYLSGDNSILQAFFTGVFFLILAFWTAMYFRGLMDFLSSCLRTRRERNKDSADYQDLEAANKNAEEELPAYHHKCDEDIMVFHVEDVSLEEKPNEILYDVQGMEIGWTPARETDEHVEKTRIFEEVSRRQRELRSRLTLEEQRFLTAAARKGVACDCV